MRRRLLIAGAAAAIAAAALSLGDALQGGSGQAAARPEPGPTLLAGATAGLAGPGGSAQMTVDQLQARLRANPRDAQAYALLGLAYEQRARETGDPAYYTKAGGVL